MLLSKITHKCNKNLSKQNLEMINTPFKGVVQIKILFNKTKKKMHRLFFFK